MLFRRRAWVEVRWIEPSARTALRRDCRAVAQGHDQSAATEGFRRYKHGTRGCESWIPGSVASTPCWIQFVLYVSNTYGNNTAAFQWQAWALQAKDFPPGYPVPVGAPNRNQPVPAFNQPNPSHRHPGQPRRRRRPGARTIPADDTAIARVGEVAFLRGRYNAAALDFAVLAASHRWRDDRVGEAQALLDEGTALAHAGRHAEARVTLAAAGDAAFGIGVLILSALVVRLRQIAAVPRRACPQAGDLAAKRVDRGRPDGRRSRVGAAAGRTRQGASGRRALSGPIAWPRYGPVDGQAARADRVPRR